jgi:AraC-like DNA-binding protein
MSRTRRAPLVSLVEMTAPLVGYAADLPAGHVIRRHRHASAQLVYAASGVMSVITDQGRWVVPPQRAVWVPPRVPHGIRMAGPVAMRTLYLDPRLLAEPPPTCCVVQVSPLLRELILRAMRFTAPYSDAGPEARVVRVLADELETARVAPLHLPMPQDARLVRVARGLLADPADGRTLAAWTRAAGASGRTLQRRFRAETGLSFGKWRQQVRLLRALERLAAGAAVTEVAFDLGYDSPSAFVTMFRRALGTTPGRYFAASGRT